MHDNGVNSAATNAIYSYPRLTSRIPAIKISVGLTPTNLRSLPDSGRHDQKLIPTNNHPAPGMFP